jgi:hypothetical protein
MKTLKLCVKQAPRSTLLYYPAAALTTEHTHPRGGGYRDVADLRRQAFERWGNRPEYMLRVIPNGIERVMFADMYTPYFDLHTVREHVTLTLEASP